MKRLRHILSISSEIVNLIPYGRARYEALDWVHRVPRLPTLATIIIKDNKYGPVDYPGNLQEYMAKNGARLVVFRKNIGQGSIDKPRYRLPDQTTPVGGPEVR